MSTRRWNAVVGAICAAGIGVRLWFLFGIEPPIQEISDAGYYHLLGKNIAAGEGYLRPYELLFDGTRTPTAEFPPLLPIILAGPSLVGIDTILGHRVVLSILGGVTVFLVALLAKRLAGQWAGLAAAACAALHPMLIGADASLMTEGVGALLTAAVLLASLKLLDRPGVRPAVVLGALGGAAALLRGEGALLLAGCLLVVLIVLVVRKVERPVAIGGAVAGTALAVMAPWLIRNAVVFDGLVMSNNLGSVLAGSYCDETFDGPWVGSWRLNEQCFYGYGFDRGLDEAEGAAEIRADAIEYARDHLGEMPRVAAIRVARLFGVWDLEQQTTLAGFEARDPGAERLGAYVTWALIPLAAGGALVVARRERAALAVVAVPIITAVGTAAVTYGNQRFRVGADVVFIALAAALVSSVPALRARPAPEPAPD